MLWGSVWKSKQEGLSWPSDLCVTLQLFQIPMKNNNKAEKKYYEKRLKYYSLVITYKADRNDG